MRIKELLESRLNKYVIDKEEWLDIEITGRDYVNVTIVSDRVEDSNLFIEEIKSEIESYSEKEYKKGLIKIYSIDDAEEYEIKKPQTTRPNSLKEAVEISKNENGLEMAKRFKSDVISFYSYKGGVGRTLTMVHTAYLLAQKGKNVLMIDLDIEAPSLHNIFYEDVKDLKYGLVDYLYERIYDMGSDDEKINFNDIYSKIDIKDRESLKGNLYVMPAGKVNEDYIYKVSNLKPTTISKRDYLSDLIKEVEMKQNLNLDVVLIDSRTGLNDWGAISLLNLSNKVIFFVYPNSENIQGTKSLVKLIKNIKEDNLTLVFSRGEESTNESLSRSKRLFKELIHELNLGSQEFISIAYDSDIAKSSDIYPTDRMLEKCEVLADFLCEKDEIEANRKTISNMDVKGALSDLNKYIKEKNFQDNNIGKINEENIFVILNKNEDILKNYIIDRYTKSKNKPLQFVNQDKFFVQVYNKRHYVDYEFNSKMRYEGRNWTRFWHSYILYSINNLEGIKGVEELRGKELKEYIYYFNNNYINNKALLSIFEDAIKGKAEYKVILDENDDYKPPIDFEMYEHNITLCLYCDELFEDIDACIKELISVIVWLESNNIYITIKIFIKDSYDNNKVVYDKIKSNVHESKWSQDDILLMIKDMMEVNKIFPYYIYDTKNLTKGNIYWQKTSSNINIINNDVNDSWRELLQSDIKSDKDLFSNYTFKIDHILPMNMRQRNPLDLLWGKRINSGKFSKKTSQWVSERLKNLDAVNPLFICQVLQESIKLQIEKGTWDDRLIDFEILRESFDKIENKLYH